MKCVTLAMAALLLLGMPAHAAGGGDGKYDPNKLQPDAHVDVKATFAGSTISALVYRSFSKPAVKAGGASTAENLLFEAWLKEDGAARVRRWDADTGAWRPAANETWTVEGDVFCLSATSLAVGMPRLCLDTIIWGQVFSASGPKGEFLVKGNWKKGNVHGL